MASCLARAYARVASDIIILAVFIFVAVRPSAGMVTGYTDQLTGASAGFGYDGLHRLAGESYTLPNQGGLQYSFGYSYDLAGNRTATNVDGNWTYTVDAGNKYTAVYTGQGGTGGIPGWQWDADGNCTNPMGEFTFTWNALSEMTSATVLDATTGRASTGPPSRHGGPEGEGMSDLHWRGASDGAGALAAWLHGCLGTGHAALARAARAAAVLSAVVVVAVVMLPAAFSAPPSALLPPGRGAQARHTSAGPQVRSKSRDVETMLHAIGRLARLARSEAGRSGTSISHDEHFLAPRIHAILLPIEGPLYLRMAAVTCEQLKGDGSIEDIGYDNVFDLAFRELLSRLAHSSDPRSLDELQVLFTESGIQGGDLYAVKLHLDMRRRR